MSVTRRTFGILTGVVVAIAVVFAVLVFVLSATQTARFVPILSNSMAPDLPVGALAIASPVPRQDVEVGDVVIFTAPDAGGRRVIHRVEHIFDEDEGATIEGWRADLLVMSTKGDNNPAADPWIVTLNEDMVWTEAGSVPYLGQPAIWLGDPTARFIAFVLVGAALATWAILVVWRRQPRASS